MSRNNHVFQVLVTEGNQAVLAAGNSVTDLTPGQIGVFDFNTNQSIDGTAGNKNFYLAVGLDLDDDGVIDDITKSRGSHIQRDNSVYYTLREYNAGAPMKVVLKDYVAECETEYGIKLELRNKEIYQTQGYNQFTKTYSIVTSCCAGCTPTCPSGDGNEITKLLQININNDPSGLVRANAIARQAIIAVNVDGIDADIAAGGLVTPEQLDAIMAFNAAQADTDAYLYTDLEIETITQKVNSFCDINLGYFYPRQTVAIVSKLGGSGTGFSCTGAVEITQQVQFEQGSGYDLKQLEYMAKGYEGSPYRVSTLNGVANQVSYNTNAKTKYNQYVLAYDQFSRNAWLEYLNAEATYIGVPVDDTVTAGSLTTILENLLGSPILPTAPVV